MVESASGQRVPSDSAATVGSAAPARLDAIRELRRPAPALEIEAPAAPKPPPAPKPLAAAETAARPKRKLTRPLLFALLPLALIAGGYVYVTGGQVMSTDNAYVQANAVGVSTDVG
jgi:membrane fusion protein (multidrug efflux system)